MELLGDRSRLHMLLSAFAFLCFTNVFAQRSSSDTLFVNDYSSKPTLRVYGSTKFNNMVIKSDPGSQNLFYRPNGKYIIGVGVSYKRLTLNIGLPMPFVNNDNDKRGRSRYIDAQGNILSPERATNIFLQYYQGYHITSHPASVVEWDQPTEFPYRADLFQFNIGLSTLRIANSGEFSYRAAFNQDAWQKKTSGSWLYGGYATAYFVKGDSAVVPTRLTGDFTDAAAISKGTFLDLGPMGGYARTFVYKQHWFVTLSAALGVGISVQDLKFPVQGTERHTTEFGPGWHAQWRGAMGYNSRRHCVVLFYNQEHVGYLLKEQDRFAWNVGNVRIMYAKRIGYKPKGVDKGLKWLQKRTPVPLPGTTGDE